MSGPFLVSAPTYRGTFNIFSLCLSTLVICVWNAIHLDVPIYRQDRAHSLVRNVVWKLAALIAPELFLAAAIVQYANAKGLRQEAEKYLPITPSSKKQQHGPSFLRRLVEFGQKDSKYTDTLLNASESSLRRRHVFTLTHGFYAAMGGYAFDFVDDNGEPDAPAFLPDGSTRMTITAAGVRFLMNHAPDLIPDLPKTHITDRSEGNSLSKAILFLQVTWFCANAIARVSQHLPLSLLEVTTVAHGVCTLLTYALWWAKPLNIPEPTLIRGSEARKACALMKMCSSDRCHLLLGLLKFRVHAELNYITIPISRAVECVSLLPPGDSVSLTPKRQYLDGTYFTPKACILETHKFDWAIIYRSARRPWYVTRRGTSFDAVILDSVDIRRWRLAYTAMNSYGLTFGQLEKAASAAQFDYVTQRSTLHLHPNYGRPTSGNKSLHYFPYLPTIYGLAHFLRWNAHFPTVIERTLWRVATATTTFWGLGGIFIFSLVVFVSFVFPRFEFNGAAARTILASVLCVLYAAGTGYLFVESFRQLLYLEPAAYQLPAWSNYWPHLG